VGSSFGSQLIQFFCGHTFVHTCTDLEARKKGRERQRKKEGKMKTRENLAGFGRTKQQKSSEAERKTYLLGNFDGIDVVL
jgi:hypothetical protein